MKIVVIVLLISLSITVHAEGWGLGPINFGSTLKFSEDILKAKSDLAGACSIISLNSEKLPFYLREYKSVELVFEGDHGTAKLVTIYQKLRQSTFQN
jgi:hypothetical protein